MWLYQPLAPGKKALLRKSSTDGQVLHEHLPGCWLAFSNRYGIDQIMADKSYERQTLRHGKVRQRKQTRHRYKPG